MTIIYIGPGDVLKTNLQYIVIPVNVVGVMGSGMARWFKDRYPDGFAAYRKHCLDGSFTIGNLMTHVGWDGMKYLLFPTKLDWRNDSKLEYIEASLDKLKKVYLERGIVSLSIPPVGCGKGNLDFESQVRPLLYRYLEPLDLDVEIITRRNA